MVPMDVIGPDGILVLDKVSDKHALLTDMAHRLAGRAGCDEKTLMTAILKREELGSTGIGAGVALPHARLREVQFSCGMLAILARPVDFQAIDGQPVGLVALLVLPEAQPGVALQALSCISRCLRQPGLMAELRRTVDSHAAYKVLSSTIHSDVLTVASRRTGS